MKANNRVAKRYARALFDLSYEKKQLESILEDLKAIHRFLEESDRLRDFLYRPAMPHAKRRMVLEDLFQQRVHPLTYNFILFLEHKERLSFLEKICEIFHEMYLAAENVLRAEVITAYAFEQSQLEILREHLKAKFNKDILIELKDNRQMIGGFKIKIGDLVYDFSLDTQLERFYHNVIHA